MVCTPSSLGCYLGPEVDVDQIEGSPPLLRGKVALVHNTLPVRPLSLIGLGTAVACHYLVSA